MPGHLRDLLVDVVSLADAQQVVLELYREELPLILGHVDDLLEEGDLTEDFPADHHVEEISLALIIEDHRVGWDVHVPHHLAHL